MATLQGIVSKIDTYKASLQQKLANKGVAAETSEGLTALINHIDDITVASDDFVIDSMRYLFYGGERLSAFDVFMSKIKKPLSAVSAFQDCDSLTNIDLKHIDFSDCNSFYRMFNGCSKLTNIEFSENLNAEQVASFSEMFYGCSSLVDVGFLKKIITPKASSTASMFYNCSALTKVDISNFDFSSVTTLANMFFGCKNLLDVVFPENADTSKVTNMSNLFYTCTSLKSLDVSMLDTSKVTSYSNLSSMFYGCSSLETLVLPEIKSASGDIKLFGLSNMTNLLNVTFKENVPFDPASTSAAILNFTKVWQGDADSYGEYYENFANSIGPVTSGRSRTIKIHTTLYNSLTDEQKALLINKGYSITYGTS